MVAAPTSPPPSLEGFAVQHPYNLIYQDANVYLPNSKLIEVLKSTEVMTSAF